MKDFSLIRFKWTFRDYQQAVLDHAQKHLEDRKIHIVAAPGSGKTVLGLEIIRRLNAPALVLSPSVSIKQQWGERFCECYLPETEKAEEYISYDLTNPQLLTSVTYQALHAAMNRTALQAEEEEDALETEAAFDFSGFDLLESVRTAGITTLCLDEAHHLKSEWQRALEKFISALGKEVTVISLTATPPYDAAPGEWQRYTKLCGEIDEEIFVPQLVKQKTLCPHQDYIYFSYPTAEEEEMLRAYRQKAKDCTQRILKDGYMTAALRTCGVVGDTQIEDTVLYAHADEFAALLTIAKAGGADIPQTVCSKIFGRKPVPGYSEEAAQAAFQFVIDSPELFSEALSEEIKGILAGESLIEKRKVCLITNDKLNRMLAASMGKLKSIETIAQHDVDNLGDGLRMLILTDFIKKDVLKSVGTEDELHTMGAVPVFEAVRRKAGDRSKIALLTGTLVILPDSAIACAQDIARAQGAACTVRSISGTAHSEVVFSGSNKHKVSIITKVFAAGEINILVGTKSLLGEGWDSPNINSLILASFVGSFMLSNQMRGRAIRIDKNNPDKVSDIWHLVTVLPDTEKRNVNEIGGDDFETVSRRFNCFQAPAYNSDFIENGIKRVDILKPPYNADGIDRINAEMLRLAAAREDVTARWNAAVRGSAHPEVREVCEVPASVYPKREVDSKKKRSVLLAVLAAGGVALAAATGGIGAFFALCMSAVSSVFCLKNASFVTKNATPEKTVRGLADAVLKTLQQMKEIDTSPKIKTDIQSRGENLHISLTGASEREKKVFIKAVSELFAPIDDPRYVIISTKKLFGSERPDYKKCYACPSVIGVNKETAAILQKNLKAPAGTFALVFTKNDNGKKVLAECKKNAE